MSFTHKKDQDNVVHPEFSLFWQTELTSAEEV